MISQVVDIKVPHYRGEPSFVLLKSSPRRALRWKWKMRV